MKHGLMGIRGAEEHCGVGVIEITGYRQRLTRRAKRDDGGTCHQKLLSGRALKPPVSRSRLCSANLGVARLDSAELGHQPA